MLTRDIHAPLANRLGIWQLKWELEDLSFRSLETETYLRIARDKRHEQIQLLSYEVIDARLFEAWAMKGIGVFDNNSAMARQLIEKYGEQDGGVRFPLESWLALSMIYDIRAIQELPEWKR